MCQTEVLDENKTIFFYFSCSRSDITVYILGVICLSDNNILPAFVFVFEINGESL
jgi:hypothetical protein